MDDESFSGMPRAVELLPVVEFGPRCYGFPIDHRLLGGSGAIGQVHLLDETYTV